MVYTFTPTGQAAKFYFKYFTDLEYIIIGDSGARVPIYRSSDFVFTTGSKTIDLKISSNAAYKSLLDVTGADALSILSIIQSHMSANNVEWYYSPGITTNTVNYKTSDNGGFCVDISSSMAYFDMLDSSLDYRTYFTSASGDKVILCTDANGKMGWVYISPANDNVRLLSSGGVGSVEVEDLPADELDPTSMYMGWLVGRWIAAQRGKKPPEPDVPKEPIAYLYNGVELPDIGSVWTDKVTYPYACIGRKSESDFVVAFTNRTLFKSSANSHLYGITGRVTYIRYTLSGNEWVYHDSLTETALWAISNDYPPMWANFDVLAGDKATVLITASEPIPVYES